jgi:hypothetical protein
MSFYLDQEDDLGEACQHQVQDGVCELCFCQVTEFDSRPGFSLGIKRISGADYASGTTSNTAHGVVKTFSEKSNISDTPKSVVLDVCSLYDKVSGKSVMRGTQRMGVIAACLNQIYLKKDIFLSEKKLLLLFGIHKKDLSTGETLLSLEVPLLVPKLSVIISNACQVIGIKNQSLINQAVSFGELMKPTDHLFNKIATPTVGAGFLYAFLELKPEAKTYLPKKKSLTLPSFSKELGVSSSTVRSVFLATKEVIEKSRSKKKV